MAASDLTDAEKQRQELAERGRFYLDLFQKSYSRLHTHYSHLFPPNEYAILDSFGSTCSRDAQSLFVRLYLRSRSWKRVSTHIDYVEVKDKYSACAELVKCGLLLDLGGEMETIWKNGTREAKLKFLDEVLGVLSAPEVKQLGRQFKLSNSAANKSVAHQSIMTHVRKTRSLVGDLCTKVTKDALKIIGGSHECVRVPQHILRLIEKLHCAYFCSDCLVNNTSMKDQILAFIGKRKYPEYALSQETVFRDARHLEDYFKARETYLSVCDMSESKNYEGIEQVFRRIHPTWKMRVLSITTDQTWYDAIYDPLRLQTKIMDKCTGALATLKKYRTEAELLQDLLLQTEYLPEKRGRWYARLLLVLHKYIGETPTEVICIDVDDKKETKRIKRENDVAKKNERKEREMYAFDVGLRALEDDWLVGGHRFNVIQRLVTISGKDEKMKACLNTALAGKTQGALSVPVKTMYGHKAGGKAGSKSIWESELSGNASVEEFVLERYYITEGWNGYHCEGSMFTTIYSLLFYDIIFAEVTGAFQHDFQVRPLDMQSKWFYQNRKQSIDERVELISRDFDWVTKTLLERFSQLEGVMIVGVNWEFESTNIIRVCEGLGPVRLAKVCEIMAKNWKRQSGLPDLVLWKDGDTGSVQVRLVEVKGPGDRLMDHQTVWIRNLLKMGVDVEVCRVIDLNSASSPSRKRQREGSAVLISSADVIEQHGERDEDLEKDDVEAVSDGNDFMA